MWSRLVSRSLVLGAVATLAGITYYFLSEFRAVREREQVTEALREVADEDGPCAALAAAKKLQPAPDYLRHTIASLRQSFAMQVVGDDKPGRKVLLEADAEGIVDRAMCDQVKLARDVGEVHPVFALLRYTRYAGRVCEEEPRLGQILAALSSHRALLLHAIMKEVHELRCLSPALSERIASMTVDSLVDAPRALDDLDVLRIAGFLEEWAPEKAARLGCRVEALGEPSRLGTALGCTPDHRRRVLTQFSSTAALAQAGGQGTPLPPGRRVVLLREDGDSCEVMPVDGDVVLYRGPCTALTLVSDLYLAVRIEAITYGRAAADLVAGLATYAGERHALLATTKEPELRSWFGYNAEGELLGPAHLVELRAVAAMLGEEVPERPLRAFCQRSGARYCYDVDWAHAVSRLPGEAVIFLSRPSSGVFLRQPEQPSEEQLARFRAAFGRAPLDGASLRILPLAKGGELLVEALPDNVELRWRLSPKDLWSVQSLGRSEGGAAPPSARLLAALDLQQDGRPELVVQRVTREVTPIGTKDSTDEVVLLHLGQGAKFTTLNRLTVHEY